MYFKLIKYQPVHQDQAYVLRLDYMKDVMVVVQIEQECCVLGL